MRRYPELHTSPILSDLLNWMISLNCHSIYGNLHDFRLTKRLIEMQIDGGFRYKRHFDRTALGLLLAQ